MKVGTAALVLCGGQSSRMGFDKALLHFSGVPLLERVVGNLGGVCDPIILALGPDQELGRLPAGVLTVRDATAHQGPLWGLTEGFQLAARAAPRVLVMAVDQPFFSAEWMERAIVGMTGVRACLYEAEGYVNALAGCYDTSLLGKLRELVNSGARRPLALSRDEPTRVLAVEELWDPGQGPSPLMDVDTPQAYRCALVADGAFPADAPPVTLLLPPEGIGQLLPPRTQPFLPLNAHRASEAIALARELLPMLEALCLDAPRGLALRPPTGNTPIAGTEPLSAGWELELVLP